MHLIKTLQPILVTGAHRSGTTWIGRTIYQHPSIRYVHEPFNVSNPNPYMDLQLETWLDDATISSQQNDILSAFKHLLQPNSFKYAAEVCSVAGIDVFTPVRYVKHLIKRPRILVKDPIALLSAGWLYDIFKFQVIVMIRNPYAFIGSIKVSGWDLYFESLLPREREMRAWLRDHGGASCCDAIKFGGDGDLIDRAILVWNILHFVIMEYRDQYPEWLYLRHEDVARNPIEQFAGIFSYLELDYTDPVKDYIEQYSGSGNIGELRSSEYQPLNAAASLDTWKKRLSDAEISRVSAATSVIAHQFYDSDMLPDAL